MRADRDDLEQVKKKYPSELTEVLLEESLHYSSMYERIKNVLSETVEQKIARELLDMAEDIGRDTKRGLELVIRLTRREISRMIGCTHESVSRIMSRWETDGIIETDHKKITLLNSDKLQSGLTRMTRPDTDDQSREAYNA